MIICCNDKIIFVTTLLLKEENKTLGFQQNLTSNFREQVLKLVLFMSGNVHLMFVKTFFLC